MSNGSNTATAPVPTQPAHRPPTSAASGRVHAHERHVETLHGGELALIGIDLLAFTRTLPLEGELALAEPKKLRYRLLHVAAASFVPPDGPILRIAQTWPWASELAAAYTRLAALPRPIG